MNLCKVIVFVLIRLYYLLSFMQRIKYINQYKKKCLYSVISLLFLWQFNIIINSKSNFVAIFIKFISNNYHNVSNFQDSLPRGCYTWNPAISFKNLQTTKEVTERQAPHPIKFEIHFSVVTCEPHTQGDLTRR